MKQCLSPRVVINNDDGTKKYIGITNPDILKGKSYKLVPCRQCFNCRLKKSSEWVQRCKMESLEWKHIYFFTLTYNDDNLPKDGLLEKRDYQNFFKRLRKQKWVFRYFLCGEYGPRTNRPHYHFIMFTDTPITDLKKIGKYYVSPYFEKVWNKGFISIVPALDAAIAYVALYTTKKQKRNWKEIIVKDEQGKEIKKIVGKEFLVCSKKPALGSKHIKDNYKDYVNNNLLIPNSLLTLSNFNYYDLIDIKENRQEYIKSEYKKIIKEFGTWTAFKDAEKSKINITYFKRTGI